MKLWTSSKARARKIIDRREPAVELTAEEVKLVSGGAGEQKLNIGSATGGAGAGKICFNPF